VANKISDTQLEASHLPGQGLQRRARKQAQKRQTPDIEGSRKSRSSRRRRR
jgi:hypothetical protein